MRPGPPRDPSNAKQPLPNTCKMMAQLVKTARGRGCSLEYLQSLLKEEWDRAVKPRPIPVAVVSKSDAG